MRAQSFKSLFPPLKQASHFSGLQPQLVLSLSCKLIGVAQHQLVFSHALHLLAEPRHRGLCPCLAVLEAGVVGTALHGHHESIVRCGERLQIFGEAVQPVLQRRELAGSHVPPASPLRHRSHGVGGSCLAILVERVEKLFQPLLPQQPLLALLGEALSQLLEGRSEELGRLRLWREHGSRGAPGERFDHQRGGMKLHGSARRV
mmetsp:Transcript_21084/g.39625  ORF Transcript_21084/g.39625 Transcript_21084/m.39625 type:complete len:203 (-) Transcript_21084:8-616(-)